MLNRKAVKSRKRKISKLNVDVCIMESRIPQGPGKFHVVVLVLTGIINRNMDVQYRRSKRQTKAAYLCQPITWSMAAILRDSLVAVAVVAVAVVVVRTRPRAIPLAMITMRKFIDGFP